MRRPSPISFAVFAVLWWALAGTGLDAVPAGVVAAGGASLVFGCLGGTRGPRIRVRGALSFLPYFMNRAIRGGVDVALRAFSPGLPLAPDLLKYRIRLEEGPARTLFVNAISLLPGTFSADLEGSRLTVHLLAYDARARARLEDLEARTARIFGVQVGAAPGSGEG